MPDPLWEIDATLKAKGFEFTVPPLSYRGPISVHGHRVIIDVEIPDVTFAEAPIVRLADRSELPDVPIAHLLDDLICYIGEAGLPLNMYDPGGSMLRVLIEAEEALKRSFGKGAAAEFDVELASYWQGKPVYFAVRQRDVASTINAELITKPGKDSDDLVVVDSARWPSRSRRQPAHVINFIQPLRYAPPFPPNNLGDALNFIAAQEAPPPDWRESILAASAKAEAVFLSAPNAKIGWIPIYSRRLKAVAFQAKGFRPGFLKSAIEKGPHEIELERLTGMEVGLQYCIERNLLGQTSLIGKRICLIGCGTIGGYLGRLLVQSGAGCGATLTIYDSDVLSAGNVGRHILGFNDLGKPKAKALADYLRTFHPDVVVESHNGNALSDPAALACADLIIDATGDPNVSTALNDLHHRKKFGQHKAILYTWVFGNGVAAQTFLDVNDDRACYLCLKTGFNGEWRFNPLKDQNSPLRQAAARCGEAGYVPFSTDGPVAAAALAIRAALDWAAGIKDPRLRTTVLDMRAGRSKMANSSPEPLEGCVACGRSD